MFEVYAAGNLIDVLPARFGRADKALDNVRLRYAKDSHFVIKSFSLQKAYAEFCHYS
jgi:hypothetical protein